MDPFGNLFSFINNDDFKKEEEEVDKFLKDIDKDCEKKKVKGEQKPKRKRKKLSQTGCKLCEEGELHEECEKVEKRRTRGKKTDGEYKCDKCEYTCDKDKLLRFHIEAVHLQVKNFKCSLCSHSTYFKQATEKHLNNMHKEGNCRAIKIGCSLCETDQIHKICEGKAQKPDGKYSCDKCDFTTNHQISLKNHNEAVHLKTKNFRCSACVFVKFKKEEIRRHIKLKHKNETCRIIKIGCSPCETNQNHQVCEDKIKSNQKTKNGALKCTECAYRYSKF